MGTVVFSVVVTVVFSVVLSVVRGFGEVPLRTGSGFSPVLTGVKSKYESEGYFSVLSTPALPPFSTYWRSSFSVVASIFSICGNTKYS